MEFTNGIYTWNSNQKIQEEYAGFFFINEIFARTIKILLFYWSTF